MNHVKKRLGNKGNFKRDGYKKFSRNLAYMEEYKLMIHLKREIKISKENYIRYILLKLQSKYREEMRYIPIMWIRYSSESYQTEAIPSLIRNIIFLITIENMRSDAMSTLMHYVKKQP